jgi:hypothetical protein
MEHWRRWIPYREIAFKTLRGFRAKNFSISTTCVLWRETFLIILPRAEARGLEFGFN